MKTCFAMEDTNPDLVFLLFYHVKCLFISHISQVWQVMNLERGGSICIGSGNAQACRSKNISISIGYITLSIDIQNLKDMQPLFRKQGKHVNGLSISANLIFMFMLSQIAFTISLRQNFFQPCLIVRPTNNGALYG